MGGLLNSSYLFFFIGMLLGLYLGSKTIRASVNVMIDKYLLKKKQAHPPTKQPYIDDNKPRRTVIVNGVKYTEDTTQNND